MSIAEILSLISTISFVIAAVSLALAVFFWFSFKIPSVIGDLSGRTAKKSIARMRANNEKVGGQGYGPSAANAKRGKLTDTMEHSRKLEEEAKKKTVRSSMNNEQQMPETGLLASNKAAAEEDLQTAALVGGEETGLLQDTTETVPLFAENQKTARQSSVKLTMLDDVMLIHTDEVI